MLPPLFTLFLQTAAPVFNGISVDGTISLAWILAGLWTFAGALFIFFLKMWLNQRDHGNQINGAKETISNIHLQNIANLNQLRQEMELRLTQETHQRMEDLRKVENKQAEAERRIEEKLQTIHENQLKSSACLENLMPAMTQIQNTLHGIFEKYDLPLKK